MAMHVVHVEDESQFRSILGLAFQAAEPDIRLCQFASGDDALPYIQANAQHIDLFVLDIRLPGSMTGVQVAEHIRALNCPGYIVLTSAYGRIAPDKLTQ